MIHVAPWRSLEAVQTTAGASTVAASDACRRETAAAKEISRRRLFQLQLLSGKQPNTPLLFWNPDPSIVYWLGPLAGSLPLM